MKFPDAPCMICGKEFRKLNGIIVVDNFADKLEGLVGRYSSVELAMGEHTSFVNAVTNEYFEQFPTLFGHQHEDIATLGDIIEDELIDEEAHKYRLQKVLEAVKREREAQQGEGTPAEDYKHWLHLFLLAHEDCLPVDGDYVIELSRINKGWKAVDWTIQLAEKVWWNPYGWVRILEHLFERKDC